MPGLNPRHVRNEIRREIGTGESITGEVLPLTPRGAMVLSLSIFWRNVEEEVDEAHLLLALLQEGESVPMRKLIELEFNINHWLQKLLTEAYEKELSGVPPPASDSSMFNFISDDDDFELVSDDAEIASADIQPEMRGRVPTPLLDKYGRDLTAQAAQGKIRTAIARESEIRALARTLARSKKNNPLLLGDAGVGKTAVVEGLAYSIFEGSAPASLLKRRIVQIEIGTLVAGTSLRGQFEERLIGIIDEARNAGNVIMFINDPHHRRCGRYD